MKRENCPSAPQGELTLILEKTHRNIISKCLMSSSHNNTLDVFGLPSHLLNHLNVEPLVSKAVVLRRTFPKQYIFTTGLC